jgi:hypothetical protein
MFAKALGIQIIASMLNKHTLLYHMFGYQQVKWVSFQINRIDRREHREQSFFSFSSGWYDYDRYDRHDLTYDLV